MSKKPKAQQTRKKKQQTPPPSGGAASRTIGFVLAAIAFLLYANTLGHGYVLDDDLALSLHENVPKGFAGILDIFLQPYRANCFGGCLYRPLTLATFAFEWQVAPNSPFIGHLFNVLWFSATVLLIFHTFRLLLPKLSPALPIGLALLFAAHPIHTEVVANIKSRDEILSLFFVMLALYYFAKQQGKFSWQAGLAFLAALLSKEGAITALAIFPLASWALMNNKLGNVVRNTAGFLIPTVVFFLMRGAALNGLTEPATNIMDNPIVGAANVGERFGTGFSVLFEYLKLLVLPFKLVSDYTYNTFPLQSMSSVNAMLGLTLSLGILGYSVWKIRERNRLAFAGLAFLASISLYSQILIVIGTLMGERLLYSPSLWFLLAISLLLYRALNAPEEEGSVLFSWKTLPENSKRFLMTCLALAIVYGFLTIQRNRDWKDNLSLFRADVVKAPNSVRLNDGYAENLHRLVTQPGLTPEQLESILSESEKHSQKSLEIKPGVSAYNNLGNLYHFRKDYEKAVEYYKKALEVVPGYNIAKKNISNSLLAWGRQEGEQKGNPEGARNILLQALEYTPEDANIHHLIGISYGVQGRHQEAIPYFQKAAELAPGDEAIRRDLNTAMQASQED